MHALIHVLQPKEKRYFRLYAQRTGQQSEKKYILLYDYLLKQPTWSEKDVRTTFAQEAFVKQLNVACKYLYELLLSSLRAYDQDRTFTSEASRRLDEIVLLYERKLNAQCRRRIQLAIRFAERLDLPHLHLQALEYSMRLFRADPQKDDWPLLLADIDRTEQLTRQLALESRLDGLYSQLFALEKWPSANIAEVNRKELTAAIAADPALQVDPDVLSFDAKIHFFNIHWLIARASGDHDAQLQAHSNKLACWDNFPRRIEVEPARYLRALSAFIDFSIEAEQYQRVPASLRIMKWRIGKSAMLQESYQLLYMHLELRYLLNIRNLTQALRFTQEIRADLQDATVTPKKSGSLPIYTNAALVHFLMSSWEGCLEWLAGLEPFLKGGLRIGATRWVGPIRIMAFYSGNYLDKLERALRAWRRNTDAGPLAPLLHDRFMDLLRAQSDADEHAALRLLITQVQTTKADKSMRELIQNWALSRLGGKPLSGFYPPLPPPEG